MSETEIIATLPSEEETLSAEEEEKSIDTAEGDDAPLTDETDDTEQPDEEIPDEMPDEETDVQEKDPCEKLQSDDGPKMNENTNLQFMTDEEGDETDKKFMEASSVCDASSTRSKEELKYPSKDWRDPVTGEMHYYLSTIRLAVPNMTNNEDKLRLRSWIFFLLKFVENKSVRNRYLLLVTLSAICDECFDIMKQDPPMPTEPCLPPLTSDSMITLARWETDIYWDRLVADIKCIEGSWAKCSLHKECIQNAGLEKGTIEAVGGHLMDQEFKYLLYLIRSLVGTIKSPEAKTRVSMWIQRLGTITPSSCIFMKGLRNDYMQSLLGYLSAGLTPGPFKKLPSDSPLIPLAMEAKKSCNKSDLSKLNREAAEEFLAIQTPLENGAICYTAISGTVNNNNLKFSPLD